jgi:hypothetical protein
MFAKIENNQVVQWPIPSITALFPNTSFPSPLTATDLPIGYVAVGTIPPPQLEANQKFVSGQPIQQDGKWVQSWDILSMTAGEIDARDMALATSVRAARNKKLAASDWTQVIDAPVDQVAWATYRQALRDITAQKGFPSVIQWPVAVTDNG